MIKRKEYYYCGFNLKILDEKDTNNISETVRYPTSLNCMIDTIDNNLKECWLSWHSLSFITHDGKLLFYPGIFAESDASLTDKLSSHSLLSVNGTGQNLYILTKSGVLVTYDLCESITHRKVIQENQVNKTPQLCKISCTENLILGLDENGDAGEICLPQTGSRDDSCCVWSHISLASKIKDISCGKEHVLMLTAGGGVLTHGNGSRGQLGNGSTEIVECPAVLTSLQDVIVTRISCGAWHSVVVSDIGDVYVWGWNRDGQLGLPAGIHPTSHGASDMQDRVTVQYTPALLESFSDVCVTKAACGSRHTALLTDRGEAYTSGWNDYGQLGQGDATSRDDFTLVAAFCDVRVIDIFAANWATIIVT